VSNADKKTYISLDVNVSQDEKSYLPNMERELVGLIYNRVAEISAGLDDDDEYKNTIGMILF
jgi:hypothetical protein